MSTQEKVHLDDSAYYKVEDQKVLIEDFLLKYSITNTELDSVRNDLVPLVKDYIDDMIREFYTWMKKLPEYNQWFGTDKELLKRVQKAQKDYWIDMLSSDINQLFLEKRISLARTHSRIELPLDSYFAGMAYFTNWIIERGLSSVEKSTLKQKDSMYMAISVLVKVVQIDQAIVVDEYVRKSNYEKNQLIQRQAATITKLSTPVAILAEDILLVTIVGVIDSKRAQEMLETTLSKVMVTASKVTIIDITGVDMVDTAVANYLVKMFQSIKLMGCHCLLSGVSPEIAQTIVHLGIDLSDVITKSALRDAVEAAYDLVSDAKK